MSKLADKHLNTEGIDTIMDRLTLRTLERISPKENLIRDVGNLLNTKLAHEVSSEYPELQKSILNYGLPNFASLETSTQNAADVIKKRIENLLTSHEPRLKNINVNVGNIEKYSIGFTINATLLAEPEPLNIQFDSNYQPDINKFKVENKST